jgi:hypothetical protein
VVGLVLIAPAAAWHLNPKRQRVVRTTRGVRAPAAKAAGGRAGRPGEKPHAPRGNRATPAPRTPARPRPQAPAAPRWEPDGWRAPPAPEPELSWPHRDALSRLDLLPWARPQVPEPPAPEPAPKRLRRDPGRPSGVHRKACGDCAAGCCQPGPCPARGCECAAPAHEIIPF